MNGILNVNKPDGLTSFKVVAGIKRWSGEKQVGHAGTLDPIATGVLPVCLGQATRVIEFLMDTRKTYQATIELGIATDTYDADGKVVKRGDAATVSLEKLKAALAGFQGNIEQIPPVYSALKQNGKPLYYWARAGVAVKQKSRRVVIHELELIDWQSPLVTVRVVCGKGTYIRSLANDLGEKLGCGACMKNLIRTKYGPFDIKDSVALPRLAEILQSGNPEELLYPIDSVLLNWKAAVIEPENAQKILNGQYVTLPESYLPEQAVDFYCRAYSAGGTLLAVLHYNPEIKQWHPDKVFIEA